MTGRLIVAASVLATVTYLSCAAVTWARFGKNARRGDGLLDVAMPEYDVRLYHEVTIRAAPDEAFDALCHADLERSLIVQALFRAREILLAGRHQRATLPQGLLNQLDALGWRIVAEEPGRELAFGAVTQPWRAKPVFYGLPPAEFARFNEPGYAKIAFTIRIDPTGSDSCVAGTETRVQTTDAESRARFRCYWAFLSPGIELVRVILLRQIKCQAERR